MCVTGEIYIFHHISPIMSHADLPFSSLRSMARGWTYISDFNIFQGTSWCKKHCGAQSLWLFFSAKNSASKSRSNDCQAGKQTTRLTKFEQLEIRNLFFFLNKANHTYLWRLFFSWQLCGQSDSFRPVEVVLNHQLLPSFIRFLSLRTPTTPSTHHFSAREAVRGDPANIPTKKEMW